MVITLPRDIRKTLHTIRDPLFKDIKMKQAYPLIYLIFITLNTPLLAYVGPALSFSMLGTLWAFLAGFLLSSIIIFSWLFKLITEKIKQFFKR